MLAIRFGAVVIVSHAWFRQCPTFPMAVQVSLKGASDGYFSLDVYMPMKILCAEKGLAMQEFLRAGVNAVFRMHDKPPIA